MKKMEKNEENGKKTIEERKMRRCGERRGEREDSEQRIEKKRERRATIEIRDKLGE